MDEQTLKSVERMRLLLVHPGADWAVSDVFDGYYAAFKALGHEVGAYNLHVRLARAGEWLAWNWKKAGKPDPRPNEADIQYLAGADLITASLRSDADWLIVFSGMYLHPDIFIMLRRAGRRIVLVLTESPYEDDRQIRVLPYADIVFTNERTSVDRLRGLHPNVLYIPHSYDPAKHYVASSSYDVPGHDVVFVGTAFPERIETLSAVDWTGIDLGLYGSFELLGSRSKLRKYLRGGPIDNATASNLYRAAKVGLNLHRQSVHYSWKAPRITTAESLNPRAVELAACGVFTISDARAELAEVFGDLVPTFGSPGELGSLVRYWLGNDAERMRVATELPRCVTRMTFKHRAEHIAAYLWAARSARPQQQGVA